MKYIIHLIFLGLCISSCNVANETNLESRTRVEINTTKGKILVELYNETPNHRDNFIKLVNDKFYDSVLFHRVIDNFVIQTGDPFSRDAKPGEVLGEYDVGYLVPSEIIDTIFHKRGTLSAAHDSNPDLSSSGSHFVITQMGPVPDSLFEKMENKINNRLAVYQTFHADSNAAILSSAKKYYEEGNFELYEQLYDSIRSISSAIENPDYFEFPKSHIDYYKKFGGVPRNDRIYTVFGEVLIGMDIVDSIAATDTDENDRPLTDVRIISMRVIK